MDETRHNLIGADDADGNRTSGSFSESVFLTATRHLQKWKEGKFSSRRVVSEIQKAFGKGIYGVQTCALLLALENRIAERYATFFKMIFRWFSYKKESRLLYELKRALKIPKNVTIAQYMRFSDNMDGGDFEGERSGGGKRRAEKQTLKEKKAFEKKDRQAAEIKNSVKEQAEQRKAEGKEPETEKTERKENLKRTEKPLYKKESSRQNAFKAQPESQEKQKAHAATEKKPYAGNRKDQPSSENNADRTENTVAESVEQKKVLTDNTFRIADVPLELYQNNFKEKSDEGTNAFRDEYYNRPLQKQPSSEQSVRPNASEVKNTGRVPTEKSEELPAKKIGENDSDRPFQKATFSEENKARIEARGAFEKMSVEELTAIRQAMQESLNREMERAVANGEIYKMPITIKEALENPSTNRSERRDRPPQSDVIIKK